jgi:hypothetical protein
MPPDYLSRGELYPAKPSNQKFHLSRSLFWKSYQNIFRIIIWLIFLFVYSQAGQLQGLCFCPRQMSLFPVVREPLEQFDQQNFDKWEIGLYILSLSFLIEGELSLSNFSPHQCYILQTSIG